MTDGLFRLALPDGTIRLGRGDVRTGPTHLLPPDLTVAGLLQGEQDGLATAIAASRDLEPVPADARIRAPVDAQEVWAAGVTYERSRDARVEESVQKTVYDLVYTAERPELFFKAAGWRVRGPGETIGIRVDSAWNVPEPELALFVTDRGRIAGYGLANDVSSRTIEGENPLYLPQAKVYDLSCALGPAIIPASADTLPIELELSIERDGDVVFHGSTSTRRITRPLDGLVEYLTRAMSLPDGAVLLTGTGIVPDSTFTLRPGDVVRIDGGPLGRLENTVVEVGRGAP
jgi:2-dehydro-3-deoxy-D-arabinonate dehydratase